MNNSQRIFVRCAYTNTDASQPFLCVTATNKCSSMLKWLLSVLNSIHAMKGLECWCKWTLARTSWHSANEYRMKNYVKLTIIIGNRKKSEQTITKTTTMMRRQCPRRAKPIIETGKMCISTPEITHCVLFHQHRNSQRSVHIFKWLQCCNCVTVEVLSHGQRKLIGTVSLYTYKNENERIVL